MSALLVRMLEYFHRASSNNLHNYIVASFLALCICTALAALGMTIACWWRGLPKPPEEIFTLLQMELYALGGYAGLNATAHTYKAVKGKSGANTPGPEPAPAAEPEPPPGAAR